MSWALTRAAGAQNDAEKDKMRSALGNAILVERPNVKVPACLTLHTTMLDLA